MKTLFSSLIFVGVFSPIVVSAQQTNTYQVCHIYQEQYSPGYYGDNGSYIQGQVYTIKNDVNCQTGKVYSSQPYNGSLASGYQPQRTYYQPQRTYYRRQRVCNPTAGALIGGGLASALSGGTGWNNSGSWNRTYSRNSSSGSWKNSYKNNGGWTAFGAGLGALAFSC